MSSHGFLPSAKIVSFAKLIGAGSKLLQNSDLRDLMCFKVSTAPALQDVPDLLKNLKRIPHNTHWQHLQLRLWCCVHLVSYTFYDCPLNFISNSRSPSFLPPSFLYFLLSFFPSESSRASCKLTIWSDGPWNRIVLLMWNFQWLWDWPLRLHGISELLPAAGCRGKRQQVHLQCRCSGIFCPSRVWERQADSMFMALWCFC